MARVDEDETPWSRQLLVVVGVLVAVALVIGGVVSVVALGLARVSGIADARPSSTEAPTLFIPSGEPTTRPESLPDPQGTQDASRSPSPKKPSPTRTRPARAISLQASPRRASPNERISLTGTYRGGSGATLQVQRFQGGWVDFPVTASVRDGTFSTYIYTGRVGTNRLRVVDRASGRSSNAVRVTVG